MPEYWSLPTDVNIETIYQHWFRMTETAQGDKVPPLRSIRKLNQVGNHTDPSRANCRRRFADVRTIMNRVEEYMQSHNINVPNPLALPEHCTVGAVMTQTVSVWETTAARGRSSECLWRQRNSCARTKMDASAGCRLNSECVDLL